MKTNFEIKSNRSPIHGGGLEILTGRVPHGQEPLAGAGSRGLASPAATHSLREGRHFRAPFVAESPAPGCS